MAEVKLRLDELVLARGLTASRNAARAQIMAGNILVGDRPADKPGHKYPETVVIRFRTPPAPFVSRGGDKLAGALAATGLAVAGLRCLDAGASTGGFTDCLLQHGARAVVAVDVGQGQLAWSLRSDPRVTVVEDCNIRLSQPGDFGPPFDLVTADLSFISLRLVLPALVRQLRPGGHLLILVKPQFEVGKGEVGRGGVVRDPEQRAEAVAAVGAAAAGLGLEQLAVVESPVPGAKKGNREFFLFLRKPEAAQ